MILFCRFKVLTSGFIFCNLAMRLDEQFSAERIHSGESGGGGHCGNTVRPQMINRLRGKTLILTR